jgi:hypothetical protein
MLFKSEGQRRNIGLYLEQGNGQVQKWQNGHHYAE